MKTKPSRKALPRPRKKDHKVQLWTEGAEAREWEEAAHEEGLTLSGWLRRAALRTLEMEKKIRQIKESGALG